MIVRRSVNEMKFWSGSQKKISLSQMYGSGVSKCADQGPGGLGVQEDD